MEYGGINMKKGFVFFITILILAVLPLVVSSIYYASAEPQHSVGYIFSDRTKVIRFDSLESLESQWEEVKYIEELDYSLPPMEAVLSQWHEGLGTEFPDLESFLNHYGIDNLLLEFRFTRKFIIEHDRMFVRSEEFVSIVGSVALTPRVGKTEYTTIFFNSIPGRVPDNLSNIKDFRIPRLLIFRYGLIQLELP